MKSSELLKTLLEMKRELEEGLESNLFDSDDKTQEVYIRWNPNGFFNVKLDKCSNGLELLGALEIAKHVVRQKMERDEFFNADN